MFLPQTLNLKKRRIETTYNYNPNKKMRTSRRTRYKRSTTFSQGIVPWKSYSDTVQCTFTDGKEFYLKAVDLLPGLSTDTTKRRTCVIKKVILEIIGAPQAYVYSAILTSPTTGNGAKASSGRWKAISEANPTKLILDFDSIRRVSGMNMHIFAPGATEFNVGIMLFDKTIEAGEEVQCRITTHLKMGPQVHANMVTPSPV